MPKKNYGETITDTERTVITKKEITEFENEQLIGNGYRLRYDRDRGFGLMGVEKLNNGAGPKRLVIEWNIEGIEQPVGGYRHMTAVPEGHFILRFGDSSSDPAYLIDKEVFQKIFRWV